VTLQQKIITARKQQGLTQEELAIKAGLTVRTIQRIENGETLPRSHTLKAIAAALKCSFESLAAGETVTETAATNSSFETAETRHFLQMLCLSCFSFIIIPYVHFLIPRAVLKKNNPQPPQVILFARSLIRQQLMWSVAILVLMLLTLAFNLAQAAWFQKQLLISYVWPFLFMYLLNAALLLYWLYKAKTFQLKPGA
jgi:XRE family transcriptional regulator, regulator of sulfur utilization